MPIRMAVPPAPVSWLGRLAGRGDGSRREVLPSTDGVNVYLPPLIETASFSDPAQLFTLLAVEQGVRIVRESAAVACSIDAPDQLYRFMIAEAAAADQWIAREAPGLVPALRLARAVALLKRSRGAVGPIETLVREQLARDPFEAPGSVPSCATASESLAWARAGFRSRTTTAANRGTMSPVLHWGEFLPITNRVAANDYSDSQAVSPTRPRVAEIRRRPRIREAAEDEDDRGVGTWIVRADDPQESVEDPFGLQRPADCADHADPEGLGDALADLPEARVVRTPGTAREVLRAGDEPERSTGGVTTVATRAGIAYPEWDYGSRTYVHPGAVVRETRPVPGDASWIDAARTRHRSLVRRVRTRFERLRPRRVRMGRQTDGPELDIAEYVKTAADLRAGVCTEDRLYVDMRHARRELSVALLVDTSASTDAWVSGTRRIVDVEKDALLVVLEALGALGDRHAIYAFASYGPERVAVATVKTFSESATNDVLRRIVGLDADGYTRLGAAVRHVTAALSHERSDRRLLLILSDGKPNDVDQYEGRYGAEDARQSVAEARAQGIDVFCLTVDREAPRYAVRIFGPRGFAVLRRPEDLPRVLVELLRKLIRPVA